MSELPEKIKGSLLLSDVVRHYGAALKSTGGGKYVALCPFHNEKTESFNIDDERGTFKCFGCGKQGDILAFIQFSQNLMDFNEVLRIGCELAGLDYEKERGADPKRVSRNREIGDILTKYLAVAKGLWNAEKRVLVGQHLPKKTYLTEDVIERWELGIAPTLRQCESGGLSRDELRSVGLLRRSHYEEDREYMHFYDSMIIPHLKNGRCVYLADRALGPRGKDGKKKILNMPLPNTDGRGGGAMPASFNLEAMWSARAREVGVLLVEARLDALACTERGHPAVAYLSQPTPAFVAELAKCAGAVLYYCPDGTADMTPIKRAEAAGAIGWDVKCCRLPDGKDPDDLSGVELEAVKAAAGDCVEEWFGAVEATA